jgi:Domain of unknown function (DUF4262)
MCWTCDHPNGDYLAHVAWLVRRNGWAVQGVQRDQLRPPLAYTVGLTGLGLPELIVTGMGVTRATHLLNDVAAHLLHAAVPAPGEQVALTGGPLIEIVEVAEPAAHLPTAVALYGGRLRALQLVHADDHQHWPWDGWYRGVRGGQPVLGVRARRAA